MGTAFTGFLGGFVDMQQRLQQIDEQRAARQQQLEIQKEELKLRQQSLKGQEAHTILQNRALEAQLAQQVRQQQAQEQFAALFANGADLNDPATRQKVLEAVARSAGPEQVIKLQEQFRAQDDMTMLRQLGQAPSMPQQAPQVPASPLQPPPGPRQASGIVPLKPSQNKALFDSIADQVGAANGIKPEVVQLFKASVMPQETAGYNTNAVSPKGAMGIAQLMPATAQELGVRNPHDPLQSIRGGLQYLQQQWDAFGGDPAKTLAAYNAGPGAVKKYNGVPPYAETQKYVQNGVAAYQGQNGAAPAASRPGPDVAKLQQQRDMLEQQIAQLTSAPVSSKEGQAQQNRLIDNARQLLGSVNAQLQEARVGAYQQQQEARAGRQEALAQQKEAREARHQAQQEARAREPQFDKDFADYFATHHNGQRPQDAIKQPGGAEVVQQARQGFDVYDAERKANEAFLKEQKTQPLAIQRAEAQKQNTPIESTVVKSLASNKSIYNSIAKIETILREGTNLPEDFVNLVSQDAPEMQRMLQADPKNLTGILRQFETKWSAAANNDPRVNRFLSALGNMRDLILRERSGGAVTSNELERATSAFIGSLPNINQAFSLFAENLSNVKEAVVDSLVTQGSTVRPLSGGKVVFEGLPAEIKLQILRHEKAAVKRDLLKEYGGQ